MFFLRHTHPHDQTEFQPNDVRQHVPAAEFNVKASNHFAFKCITSPQLEQILRYVLFYPTPYQLIDHKQHQYLHRAFYGR